MSLALAAACTALALSALHPAMVAACSGDTTFDPTRYPGVIVVARATAIEFVPGEMGPFIGVRVTLEVERYLKGSGSTTIVALDTRSAIIGPRLARDSDVLARVDLSRLTAADVVWAGGSGACGALDLDPVGRMLVLGLVPLPDGTFGMHRMLLFAVSGQPESYTVDQATARIETLLGHPRISPPNVGHGLTVPRKLAPAAPALALLVALALVATARRSVTPRGGSPAR